MLTLILFALRIHLKDAPLAAEKHEEKADA